MNKDWKIIVVGSLLCVCGSGPFYVMPAYFESAVRDFGLSAGQIGLLSGAEGSGIALACVLTGLFARRLNWKIVAAGGLVCAVGNSLAGAAHGFGALLALRAFTGLAGEGPLYAMSYILLGKANNPDRAFGAALTALAVFSAVALDFERALYRGFGAGGILVPFAGLALVAMVAATLSRDMDIAPPALSERRGTFRWDAVLILASIGVWSAGPGAFWPFSEAAAIDRHVEASVIAHALSTSLLVGLLGSVLPAIVGDKIGRQAAAAAASVGTVAAVVVFFAGHDLAGLTGALSLLQFSWNLAVVYQLAGLASVDPTGRYSALGAVAQFGGIALGPVVAGFAVQAAGYGSLTAVVTAFVSAGLALFVMGRRATRPARAAF